MNNTPVTPNFQISPTFMGNQYLSASSSSLTDLAQFQDYNDSMSLFPRQLFSLSRNPSTTELLQYQTNQLMQISPQPIQQQVIRQTPGPKKRRTKEETKETHKAIERRRTTTIKNLIIDIKKELEDNNVKLPKTDKVSILQTAYSHIIELLNKIKDNNNSQQPFPIIDTSEKNKNTTVEVINIIQNQKPKLRLKYKKVPKRQIRQEEQHLQQQEQQQQSKVYTLHITKPQKSKHKIQQNNPIQMNQQQQEQGVPPQLQLQSFPTSLQQQQQQIPPPPKPLQQPQLPLLKATNTTNGGNATESANQNNNNNSLQHIIHSISLSNNSSSSNTNSLSSAIQNAPIISKPIPHTPIPHNNSYENITMIPYGTFDPGTLAVNFPSSPPANYMLGTSPVDSIRTPGTTAFSDFNDFNNNNNK